MLTETYRPEERAKAQGANDQMIFITMAISSFSSGLTVATAGWTRLNAIALVLVVVMGAALTWFVAQRRRARAAA